MAHLYGELANPAATRLSNRSMLDRRSIALPLSPYAATDLRDFNHYSQYVFVDKSVSREALPGLVYSNRSITTNATCVVSRQVGVMRKSRAHGSSLVNVDEKAAGHLMYFEKLNLNVSTNTTRYFAHGDTKFPGAGSCGSRCGLVSVLESRGTTGFLYSCNISVSRVFNASITEHAISDSMARMAAQSIALSGFTSRHEYQYQEYDRELPYGQFLNGKVALMEGRLRLNALGAIAGVDINSPVLDFNVTGHVRSPGSQLALDNPMFILTILGGVGGFHLVVFLLSAYLANKVILIQNSYLAISLLLEPVVQRLRESGVSVLDKHVCHALQDLEVCYGAGDNSLGPGLGTVQHLEISGGCERPGSVGGWRGRYV